MATAVDDKKRWDWPLTTDDFVTVVDDDKHFEVDLQAKSFKPEEVSVKTVGELVEIHLDHEAKGDDPMNVARNITRCYKLPPGIDTKTLKHHLDADGILHITANKL
ncbi:Hsp20/alpha crystallin family protein [Oesophagostomum dentatum]|uniref:Hsp20/alpha crystallin family protein n=1 Tax=Oesophagostomum dentatum TaxID=61180 RepID=A0A0B1TII6_OESDE|nr:Hsp20/alpha crystallin family protein [Oesophagostomum dentatum]